MAGHSQFANIKHRKGAQDAKKAKLFTKLQREITVAAKTGQPDPEFNPRLRNAIIAARSHNMPKDRIEAAIKRASSLGDNSNFEEIRYEGYGPGGVAFIVEALTDNRNRTAGEVRSIFTKSGGVLGESGSVAFLFERIGLIEYDTQAASEEEIFEAALEAGALEIESGEGGHIIICPPETLSEVRDKLTASFNDPRAAKLSWRAQNNINLNLEQAQKILKLIDTLEDNDDVQEVIAAYHLDEEIIKQLNF